MPLWDRFLAGSSKSDSALILSFSKRMSSERGVDKSKKRGANDAMTSRPFPPGETHSNMVFHG
jgi:hypothetical protein